VKYKRYIKALCRDIGKIRNLDPPRITATELGEELGVRHNSVYEWMRGDKIPSRKNQEKMKALRLRIDKYPETF
jgi:hypothetical protein